MTVRRAHEDWLRDTIALSRYSNVPIGNLTQDHPLFVCDVLAARHLRASNHLLWISETGRPDLGGAEEDDHSFGMNMHSQSKQNVDFIYGNHAPSSAL